MAAIAGAGPGRSALLGLSMLALQASIGALNDLVDAPRDAVGQPWKPIPAGRVRVGVAKLVAGTAAALGLALAGAAGPATLGLAVIVLAIGYAYDLALKGTTWSWLPFAVGIPMLPVFAWVGATARIPGSFAILVPTGVLAGAALALANSLVDVEADRRSGAGSPAQAWGPARTRRAALALLATVGTLAVATTIVAGAPRPGVAAIAAASVFAVVAGRALGSSDRRRRERAWEAQAAAVGVLGAVWVGAMAAAGRLG